MWQNARESGARSRTPAGIVTRSVPSRATGRGEPQMRQNACRYAGGSLRSGFEQRDEIRAPGPAEVRCSGRRLRRERGAARLPAPRRVAILDRCQDAVDLEADATAEAAACDRCVVHGPSPARPSGAVVTRFLERDGE